MTLPVADYSFARPADYAELARQVSGVMRYVSNGPNSKNISAAEVATLRAHGVPVGITWEADSTSMLAGAAAGRAAAASSVTMTRAAGLPDGVTYYACDFDATLGGRAASVQAVGNMRSIADFLAGAASVTGWNNVGCYGSVYVLEWLRENTRLQHGWQCAAWSGGDWQSWKWSGPVDSCAAFVQDEFWVAGQHEISISGCPVDLSTVTGDWRPRTATTTTNGDDLSMADAASLEAQMNTMAKYLFTRLDNIDAKQQFALNAEGARFDALTAALQVLHGAVLSGAQGEPVDFPAMAKILEGAQLTLTHLQEGTPA